VQAVLEHINPILGLEGHVGLFGVGLGFIFVLASPNLAKYLISEPGSSSVTLSVQYAHKWNAVWVD